VARALLSSVRDPESHSIIMATLPYFVISPSTLLSVIGLLRGPDRTEPTPVGDWREAKVDVVIPALNEEDHILLCLDSVLRQTVRPRQIVLVDDGSTDRTVARAKAFCRFRGVRLVTIQRRSPIGKTPTIKRQARELDSDVEFILDADTILESENYIERTVRELYQAIGIASACGTILPLRKRDRRAADETPSVREFRARFHLGAAGRLRRWHDDLGSAITNLYRDVLYLFLQRFIYRGQMAFFGTTTNPVGCAVAYRRKYVKAVFDQVEPTLGDDLTNSEDIFIGLALLNEGYRNIQLTDVYARTVEPHVLRLPRQVYLWSSSFLQSCYYFDALLRSPMKVHKRILRPESVPAFSAGPGQPILAVAGGPVASGRATPPLGPVLSITVDALTPNQVPRHGAADGATGVPRGLDRRLVREPYRQGFGRERTRVYGRPVGWILLGGAVEKVLFPTLLLGMALVGNWHGVRLTVIIETLICVTALVAVTKGRRFEYLAKGLAVTPIRYALIASDLVTLTRFASDLWLTNNRKWRK
jgi:glycosyltransferase involved in cell wall biosynthesis